MAAGAGHLPHFLGIEGYIDGVLDPASDLLRPAVVWREVGRVLSGELFGASFGTPCTSFGMLFQNCGPGTRTKSQPYGNGENEKELVGNAHAIATVLICLALWSVGGFFWIENPQRSFLWQLDITRLLMGLHGVRFETFDQCAYGLAPSDHPDCRYRKPSCGLTNLPLGSTPTAR